MIEIRDITFKYGRRKPAVFDDFSLTLRDGCICGLLGKNGTGKSTLLYLMSGLLRPERGGVFFRGTDMRLRRPQELEEIFLLPEEFSLPDVTLRRYVALNKSFYPRFSDALLAACLRDFDLPSDLRLGELSMGQKKKAFMSFALACNTSLLLMDEPTNGLDIPSKGQFRHVVANSMTEGRTLVISTHQVRDIDTLLDHIVMLDGSRVLLNRSVAEVSDALCFEELPMDASADDALYAQPSLHGNAVIRRNTGGRDTAINLELLFNALLADPAIAEIMQEKTNLTPEP